MATEASSQLHALLQNFATEWHAAIREIGEIDIYDRSTPAGRYREDNDGVLWLVFRGDAHPNHRQGHEGLVLLAMIAEIDPQEWTDQVCAIWSLDPVEDRYVVEHVRGLSRRSPVVGVDVNVDEEQDLEVLRQQLVSLVHPSPAYSWYADELDELRGGSRSTIDSRIPARLRVAVDAQPLDGILKYLAELALVQDHAVQSKLDVVIPYGTRQLQWRTQFRVDEVTAWITRPSPVTINHQDLQVIEAIIELGIRFRDLMPIQMEDDVPEREIGLRSLRRFLIPAVTPVNSVVISSRSNRTTLDGLLSALRWSQGVQEVAIMLHPGTRGERVRMWQWIAYALFSTQARHNVQKISIRDGIQANMFEAMHQVLKARNPLAILFQGHPSREPCGQIQASVFNLQDPPQQWTWTSPIPVLADVITRPSAGWWEVVLPGYGQAWVNSRDVLHHEVPTSTASRGVPHLQVGPGPESLDSTAKAIDLIGESIRTLEITSSSFSPEWCRARLDACPSVERLLLPSAPTSGILAMLTQASREDGVCCRLHTLSGHFRVGTDVEETNHFFQALGDNHHPFTKRLATLLFDTTILSLTDLSFIDHVFEMLKTNRSLRHFHLKLYTNHHYNRAAQVVHERFSAYLPTSTRTFTHPLAARNKWAFLSVVSRDSSAASSLDSLAIEHIFGFASEFVTGTVKVSCEF